MATGITQKTKKLYFYFGCIICNNVALSTGYIHQVEKYAQIKLDD